MIYYISKNISPSIQYIRHTFEQNINELLEKSDWNLIHHLATVSGVHKQLQRIAAD